MRSRRNQPTQPLQEPDGVGGRHDQLQRTTKAEAAAETRTPAAASPTSALPAARTSSCGSLRSSSQQPTSADIRGSQPPTSAASKDVSGRIPNFSTTSCQNQQLRLPPEPQQQQPPSAASSDRADDINSQQRLSPAVAAVSDRHCWRSADPPGEGASGSTSRKRRHPGQAVAASRRKPSSPATAGSRQRKEPATVTSKAG